MMMMMMIIIIIIIIIMYCDDQPSKLMLNSEIASLLIVAERIDEDRYCWTMMDHNCSILWMQNPAPPKGWLKPYE